MTTEMTAVPVAARVSRLAPNRLFGLLAEAYAGEAIDVGLGLPGVPPTPPTLVDAACATLRAGRHHQYEVTDGNLELRCQIAAALPVPTDPATELTITSGATEATSVAVLATVDPGDEVVIFEPFYENFLNAVVLAGGVPRLVRRHPPDWRYDPADLRAAFGPRTRAIVVSTPNNPTGHMLSADELTEIAELCERWNAVAISDEIYAGYVLDGQRHISAAELPALRERSLVAGSLSKSHAVSGWRLGYLRASPALSAAARQVHTTVGGIPPSPLQEAAARAAAADPDFLRPRVDLRAQRDAAVRIFSAVGLRCFPADGGCYVMADIRSCTDADSESLAHRFVQEAGVMVAPGGIFYADPDGPGAELIRIAFNRPLGVLDEVERRLARFRPGAQPHPAGAEAAQ
jgi:aminotransferase